MQQQQRRQDESSWRDWLDLADVLFDAGEAIGGVLADAGAAVIETAGGLLLSLLD